ncbi:MotE family protein [Henriciella aquimarina]|uniref:MotE family protein n=1 Tax=Henriciella aquimarina TaxID=545261 RepID=UPI000A021825|nr:hypothetical protein [Henriciella aquimarina]
MAGNTRTHVLLTLGALFTIGGATRIIPHTFATAEESPQASQQPAPAASSSETVQPASYEIPQSGVPEQVCFTGEEAAALTADRKAFDERSEALQDQELSIQARRQKLDEQAEELKALQATLDQRWKKMEAEAGQDLDHLAQMYGAMKPDQAAAIFDQMDPGFAAGFLRLIPSDQAGAILAGMDSNKAYVVSLKLASMNGDIRAASAQQ